MGGYRDPIDLMDCPSNMKISLCCYKKGTNNKWTQNLIAHLMVYLDRKIALVSMTYIINLNAYKLHMGDEEIFNSFINE